MITADFIGHRLCALCGVYVANAVWTTHVANGRHQKQKAYPASEETFLENYSRDCGVVVEGSLNFEVIDPLVAGVGTSRRAIIKVNTHHAGTFLKDMKLASMERADKLSPYEFSSISRP
jgi:hypothetical protein